MPRLTVDPEVVFGARGTFKFWFGLSCVDEGEWHVHAHHSGLLQRFRAAGKAAYADVIADLRSAFSEEDAISEAHWHAESS